MKPLQSSGKSSAPRAGFRVQAGHPATIACWLALVTLLVYWPVTQHDFINLDDQVYVTEQPQVLGGLTTQNMRWAFATTEGGAWHPLTWLSLMLDAEWSGQRPTAYHFTNLLLHVVNTLLIFGWLRQATSAKWHSALVAGLFALHPLHVESVAWVSERKDVLSTAFGLLALWTYTLYATARAKPVKADSTSRHRLWYCGTLICFAFSLMSKPMWVTLPFVFLLLDFWPLKRIPTWQWSDLRCWLPEKIPFLLLSLAASGLTLWTQRASDAVASFAWLSVTDRIANAFVSYARYLGKTFWPTDLAVFYPHPNQWPVLAVISAIILVAGISASVFKLRNRQPYLLVGWLWFLGTLFPVIGLVQVGAQALADRYTYIPLLGVFIALAWSVSSPPAQHQQSSRRFSFILATGCILFGLAGATRIQLGHWQNSEALFRHTLKVTHHNEIAHVNLASALLDQKEFTAAEAECRSALAINPNSQEALSNLGLALGGLERWPETEAVYEQTLRLAPKNYRALNGLGLAHAHQGKLAEATTAFRRALEIRPDAIEVLNNLGLALAMQNESAAAIQQYRRALQLNPNAVQALNNLGLALAKEENWTEAEDCYRRAIQADPKSLDAQVNWGVALSSQGKWNEAAARYRAALQMAPDHVTALYNLSALLARQGAKTEAIQHLTRAQQLQPDHPAIQELLRKLQETP